jgi:hypothetical protein
VPVPLVGSYAERMKLQHIPLLLFAGSAVLFGICAALQLVAGRLALGIVFAVIASAAVVLFFVARSGRITW